VSVYVGIEPTGVQQLATSFVTTADSADHLIRSITNALTQSALSSTAPAALAHLSERHQSIATTLAARADLAASFTPNDINHVDTLTTTDLDEYLLLSLLNETDYNTPVGTGPGEIPLTAILAWQQTPGYSNHVTVEEFFALTSEQRTEVLEEALDWYWTFVNNWGDSAYQEMIGETVAGAHLDSGLSDASRVGLLLAAGQIRAELAAGYWVERDGLGLGPGSGNLGDPNISVLEAFALLDIIRLGVSVGSIGQGGSLSGGGGVGPMPIPRWIDRIRANTSTVEPSGVTWQASRNATTTTFLRELEYTALPKNISSELVPLPGRSFRFGPSTLGPLPNGVATTFRSSSYTQVTLSQDVVLYRAFGGEARQLSAYWSRTSPHGPLQVQIDSALNPAWGNRATQVVTIRVPKGTVVYEGVSAAQPLAGGGFVSGGGSQIYIPRVEPTWILP
jgi:hypothetical protein